MRDYPPSLPLQNNSGFDRFVCGDASFGVTVWVSGETAQLRALGGEPDAGIFWRDLYAFVGTLEGADKHEAAARIYAAIGGQPDDRLSPEFGDQVRKYLNLQ